MQDSAAGTSPPLGARARLTSSAAAMTRVCVRALLQPGHETVWIWVIVAVVAVTSAAWAWVIGVAVVHSRVRLAFAGVLIAVYIVYITLRPHRRIAAFAAANAQLVAFTYAIALFTYLTVTSRFPLVDSYLARGDQLLGIDWPAFFSWVKTRPLVDGLFGIAYNSVVPQIAVLLLAFNLLDRLERARELVWLFVTDLLIVTSISWLFPAQGAWGYYKIPGMSDAEYLPDFNALRLGEMTTIVMDNVFGVIQFPSFHAALGLIFIYVARGIPYLFPFVLFVNVVMIASTPTSGGHHFTDVLAGLATVLLAIWLLRVVEWACPSR